MRIIDQSAEICKPHGYTLQNIYKDIERAARVSYKSEDKITVGSAEKMVERLIKMGHYSPLEFGTVYLTVDNPDIIRKYINNRYSKVVDNKYVTTNYRVIIENHWDDDLKYLTQPHHLHIRRITVRFVTNRAVSHELVRHRSMSFMQESQRYIAYDKGKFGSEITFIKPVWNQTKEEKDITNVVLSNINDTYMKLRELGLKPQQARQILPNATKTELYMCGFEDDWEHFFDLRDREYVDPQMYDLVHLLHIHYNAYIAEKIGRLLKSDIIKPLEPICQ